MDSISNLKKLVIITLSVFALINTTQAICVPRSFDPRDPLGLSRAPNASPPTQSSSLEANPHVNASSILISSSATITSTISNVPMGTSQLSTPLLLAEVQPNPQQLKDICKKTDYASLCLSSITPLYNGKTDTISVLETAITAATLQAKLAISVAAKLASLASVSRTTATTLKDCSDNYSDAIDNFQMALRAIKTRDIGTVNSMLSAVVTDSWTCDDEFAGKNPMAVYEEKLSNMASNCLAIASLIK